MLAQKLGEQMGQSFLVDTRPGAAGHIGMEVAVKAPPDGHTMVVIGNTQTIVPGVHEIVP
jgi:tripartite-type tricarboxylate transporter receptor subunit TctC